MTSWIALGFSALAFFVGMVFGCLLAAIFLPSKDEEEQSRAVSEEHRRWHHPRSLDDE